MPLSDLATLPGRCTSCWLHVETQGHRSRHTDGSATGCVDNGPLAQALGLQAGQAGMEQATRNHPTAAAAVDAAIARQVRAGREFSANTLRDELKHLAPHERPVIGARINAASRAKRIRRVGDTPSTDPGTHGHRISIWAAA